jgi:hypothetical protein
MENLISILGRANVQRGIESALGDREVFNRQGTLQIGFDELFARMSNARNDAFRSPASLERMHIRDMQARRALGVVLGQYERGSDANPIASLMAGDAAAGNAVIDETMADLLGSASGRAADIETRQQVDMMANGDRVVNMMADLVGPLAEFEGRFPVLTEAMGFLRDAATAAGTAMAAMALISGGSSVAGMLGAGGAAAGVAGAGGALGGGGMLAGGGGALAAGGAALAAPVAIGVGALAYAGYHSYQEDQRHSRALATGTEESRREIMRGEANGIGNELLLRESGATQAADEIRARREAAASQAALGTSPFMQGLSGGQEVRLDAASVEALATGIARAHASGAPADGRTPGEPGRR